MCIRWLKEVSRTVKPALSGTRWRRGSCSYSAVPGTPSFWVPFLWDQEAHNIICHRPYGSSFL